MAASFAVGMRNLAIAIDYLSVHCKTFEHASDERKRSIAYSLGSFNFYGKEKRLAIEICPVLRGLVGFARQLSGRLELAKTDSGSNERASQLQIVYLGRGTQTRTGDLLVPNQAH
jgi:hypothetical protein